MSTVTSMPTTQQQQPKTIPLRGLTETEAMNPAPSRVPAELVYYILAQVIGTYFADMLLGRGANVYVQTLPRLLIVSRSFRDNTIQLLRFLWGKSFASGVNDFLIGHGTAVSALCDIAQLAHTSPDALFLQVQVDLLDRAHVLFPEYPFMALMKFYLLDTAEVRFFGSSWERARWMGSVFDLSELEGLVHYRRSIPLHVRSLLVGDIWSEVVRRVATWNRIYSLGKMIDDFYGLFTLSVRANLPDVSRPQLRQLRRNLQDLVFRACEEERVLQARISRLAALDVDEIPAFTSEDLNLTRFNRMLLLVHTMANFGEHFQEIRNLALGCVRPFFSKEEAMVFFPQSTQ